MQWIKLVMIGMLMTGTSAFADISPGGESAMSNHEQISSWAARLNAENPDLKLQTVSDSIDEETVKGTLYDLETLEAVLKDKTIVPAAKLMNLACARPYCID
jgi:hypothetical protein